MDRIRPAIFCAAFYFVACSPVFADISANLGSNYTNIGLGSGFGHADGWDLNGSVAIPLGMEALGVQADGGYSSLSGGALFGSSADVWNAGGDLIWNHPGYRLALSYDYRSLRALGSTVTLNNYGAGGEWYCWDDLTLAGKGGGFSGNFALNGWYIGGALFGYATPDIAISGLVDYANEDTLHGDVDLTVKGEWLISEEVPVSVFGGYTYSSVSSNWGLGGNANTFFVGAKFYVNGSGQDTLVARQRGGTLDWTTSFRPLVAKF